MAQLGWSFSLVRQTDEPLDSTFVLDDMAAFTAYLASPFVYAGQIVAVKNGTNIPDVYLIHEDFTYGGFGGGGGPGTQGPQGFQGSQGPQGFQGGVGASLTMRGSVADLTALHALPGPHTIGDLWITTVTPARHGHVWSGAPGHVGPSTAADWDDVGEVQGPQGSIGSQGPQGFQGVQGTQGGQGAQGFQGSPGVQGVPGSGTQGSQGVQGSQGPQGIQGVQGAGSQGSQGAAGAPGSQGPQGFQGFQGAAGTVAAMGGDIMGAPSAAIVTHLRGFLVAPHAPLLGQVLMWDGTRWEPRDLPTITTPTGVVWDGNPALVWDGNPALVWS